MAYVDPAGNPAPVPLTGASDLRAVHPSGLPLAELRPGCATVAHAQLTGIPRPG